METSQLSRLLEQHEAVTAALASHLRTRQAELLDYLDANLPELQLAELKITLAFILDGRANHTPAQLSAMTGVHVNTCREVMYSSPHINHARSIIMGRKEIRGA